MEYREIKAMVLSTRNDEVFGVSYAMLLTSENLESVKLPALIKHYKYGHLLNPNYILNAELIKTRKNWVLKGVTNYYRVGTPTSYEGFLKQSECIKLVLKHLHEDQQTDILSWLAGQMEEIESVNLSQFEQNLISKLGFGVEQ
jgi:hypothetical protein